MLARLDRDLAPLHSSVDREGSVLRLQGLAGGSDLVARVAGIVEQMGYVAQPLEGTAHVTRWFGAAEADELSQEEARVLAERWVDELTAEGLIEEPQRLTLPLRDALLDTFRAAARTGAVEGPHIDAAAIRAVLDPRESEQVRLWIERKLRLPDPG